MRRFLIFDSVGLPLYTATPSDPDNFVELSAGSGFVLEVPQALGLKTDDWLIERTYLLGGALKEKPARPGEYYGWDVISESWLPNLDAARESKLQQVTTELNKRLYLPCNGFDADKVSRERISGTIARLQRGDGLPTGWMGWRDAEDQMHWEDASPESVLTNLQSLARAIEDREQSLLISAWTHKANLQSIVEAIEQDADNFESLLNYDTSAGWP